MSGIAGIFAPGRREQVRRMLDRIAHRGRAGNDILDEPGATLGAAWPKPQSDSLGSSPLCVQDDVDEGHFARAQIVDGHPMLERDPIGVAPLYYGRTEDGVLCFASEVKAMLPVANDVKELPPGHRYDGNRLECCFSLQQQPPAGDSPETIAKELRRRLADSVEKCITEAETGAWLSGGLDSSAIAALARPHFGVFHTFAAGLSGAPDMVYARAVADSIGSEHHEIRLSFARLLELLPEVIFHLESFDALLVRSSILNYAASQTASEYVAAVFSGEGSDELFAGYEYLKSVDPPVLGDELLDITSRLHNTALQRVDRCASAHGNVAHVSFLDPQVVDYALRIPADLKLHDGIEKWVLRRSMEGLLPDCVLHRRKAKFWEGGGLGDFLAHYADEHVSDEEFGRERSLSNGWTLNTKEELMYYRVFKETFGTLADLSWMGRTKGAPGGEASHQGRAVESPERSGMAPRSS